MYYLVLELAIDAVGAFILKNWYIFGVWFWNSENNISLPFKGVLSVYWFDLVLLVGRIGAYQM